jgi:hypothetical protein
MRIRPLYATLFWDTPQQRKFWFSLSLLVALGYGLWGTAEAWDTPYRIPDDGRQHLFWMQRFVDPELFPNDLIADYFQAVSPPGFTLFYRLFALLGIHPLLLSKVLPVGLGVLATIYGFRVCLQLLPVPLSGFIATLLLNQVFWAHDDLASATPRAFMPLLFLAFLDYLMRQQWWPCLVVILLEGLVYPQYVLVFAGLLGLQLFYWKQGQFRMVPFSESRFYLAGLATAVLVLLPYLMRDFPYDPVISVTEAQQLPEFGPAGRAQFFLTDASLFWLSGNRSGLFPTFKPPLMGLGLLLPGLLALPRSFPLGRSASSKVRILLQITTVALILFCAAHALLFQLHLPSRYTTYTLRFVLVFAAALSLTILLEAGLRSLSRAFWPQRLLIGTVMISLTSLLGFYPACTSHFPHTSYERGRATALYQFLVQQPKDTVVASLLKEANNLPSFAQRSVLVAPEYAVPYHLGYAIPFRQRTLALIQAQYTHDRAVLRQFVATYSVDFWLINRSSFQADQIDRGWIRQYPAAVRMAEAELRQGKPIVQQRQSDCTVLQHPNWQLLDAACLVK